ncbi:hypothetical protein JYU34_000045 [Plutella xylostella]|uniref:Uncharacterized protein n=1 Tax=Plutella xylostella TaxID=51655 RepID=A0ABQ7R6V7_PLUXY|nr:hypothetical protein JYU34_000045 [Plutella xylostella]
MCKWSPRFTVQYHRLLNEEYFADRSVVEKSYSVKISEYKFVVLCDCKYFNTYNVPRVARASFTVQYHRLLNEEYFADRSVVEKSYSVKISEYKL